MTAEAAVSFRDYFDHRIEALRNEMIATAECAQRAVGKAETATETRLSSLNDLRRMMMDERATFFPRVEYDAQHTALQREVDELRNALNENRNRLTELAAQLAGKDKGISMAAAVIYGIVIAVVSVGSALVSHIRP